MYIHAKLHFAPKHSSKKAPDLDSLHSMVLSMGKDHFQGLLVVLTLIPTIFGEVSSKSQTVKNCHLKRSSQFNTQTEHVGSWLLDAVVEFCSPSQSLP